MTNESGHSIPPADGGELRPRRSLADEPADETGPPVDSMNPGVPEVGAPPGPSREADVSLPTVSVVIPAYDESAAIADVVRAVRKALEEAGCGHEVIVVDDASGDDTGDKARQAGARVLRNPTNKGYGFSLLRGITEARHEHIAILDGDGSYPAEVLPALLAASREYDMVIVKRYGRPYSGSTVKRWSRAVFRFLAEFTAGTRIPDINSGMRVFRRSFVLRHRHAVSTGYSFTTTITLIAFLEGLHLKYVEAEYRPRRGESKVRWFRDSLRSLQIMTEVIILYNPLKFYLMPALLCGAVWFVAALAGVSGSIRWFHFWTAIAWGCTAGGLLLGLGGIAFAAGVAGRRRMPAPLSDDASDQGPGEGANDRRGDVSGQQ